MVKKTVLVLSTFAIWSVVSLFLIFFSLFIYPRIANTNSIDILLSGSSKNIIVPPNTNNTYVADVLTIVKGGDSRVVLIDKFLKKYNSPMVGLGQDFVAAADEYALDWRLLPAIAFQESSLGKKIPRGSHNPFGWGIYEGSNSGVYFDSWKSGINIVAASLNKDYISKGLSTPEEIVGVYTSNKNPSWIFSVRSAMEEISGSEY